MYSILKDFRPGSAQLATAEAHIPLHDVAG
jgi:hypothetical protein